MNADLLKCGIRDYSNDDYVKKPASHALKNRKKLLRNENVVIKPTITPSKDSQNVYKSLAEVSIVLPNVEWA